MTKKVLQTHSYLQLSRNQIRGDVTLIAFFQNNINQNATNSENKNIDFFINLFLIEVIFIKFAFCPGNEYFPWKRRIESQREMIKTFISEDANRFVIMSDKHQIFYERARSKVLEHLTNNTSKNIPQTSPWTKFDILNEKYFPKSVFKYQKADKLAGRAIQLAVEKILVRIF
jgi:hypothetical protein